MNGSLGNTSSASDRSCLPYLDTSLEEYFSDLRNFSLAAIIANVPLALLAVLGNGLVFVAYYQNESIRSAANTALVSLAITDFLSGAVCQPLHIYDDVLVLNNRTDIFCRQRGELRFFSTIFLLGATLLNLSVITLDRYVAVFHSLRYPELVTEARVALLSAIIWLAWTSTIALAATLATTTLVLIIFVIVLVSNVSWIVIANVKIYREIRRLHNNQAAVANQREELRRAAVRKSAQTVGIIVGLLFLCYVPLVLCVTFFLATKYNAITYRKFLHVARSVGFSNSALNVFVYFWKNTEMRVAMLKVVNLHGKFGRNEIAPDV